MNVNLEGASEDFDTLDWLQTSVGMMGSFITGDMLARDGITVMEDPHEFGQEWMVLDSEPYLFTVPSLNTSKCVLPSASSPGMKTRRLGERSVRVTRSEAENACSHHTSKETCISDVIATGDLDMATKIAYDTY